MLFFVFFKQKTAYEMRISDWSSDVCSSDLISERLHDVQDAATLQISDAEAEALRQRLCNVGNFRNLEAAAAETRIGVSCQREIVPPRARDRHMTERRHAFAVNDGIQQVDVRRVGQLLNVLYPRLGVRRKLNH